MLLFPRYDLCKKCSLGLIKKDIWLEQIKKRCDMTSNKKLMNLFYVYF